MPKRKFSKEFLVDQLCEPPVAERIVGKSRWSLHYERVFECEGKFYRTKYSTGATESQCELPYEYAEDVIECEEVVPRAVTVTEYVPA